MNIKDMVAVQKKNELPNNCATILRYAPAAFDGENPANSLTTDLAVVLAKEPVQDSDWIEGDEKKKEQDLIQAIIDLAEIKELHIDTDLARSDEEHVSILLTHLIRASNDISVSTRRGCGNYILLNNAFYNKLKGLSNNFNMPFFHMSMDGTEMLLNGTIRMSKAEFHEDTPLAILGYYGMKNDTGIVLVEDDDTGKYAIIDRFWDVRNYYRVIKLV